MRTCRTLGRLNAGAERGEFALRKARLLTHEEIINDRLGAHIYEETRGEEDLTLLIKIGNPCKFVSEDCKKVVFFGFSKAEKRGDAPRQKRYWRGNPSMALRRETAWK